MRNPIPALVLVIVAISLALFLAKTPSPQTSETETLSPQLPRVKLDRTKTPFVDQVSIGMTGEQVKLVLTARMERFTSSVSGDSPQWRTKNTRILFLNEKLKGWSDDKGTVWWVTGKMLTQEDSGMVLQAGDTREMMEEAMGKPDDENEVMLSGATSYNYHKVGKSKRGVFVSILDGKVEYIIISH